MVDNEGCGCAALVLVGEDGVVLEGAGGEGPVHRVAPGEGWRGLTATSDLPERGSVDSDGLGAGLSLVYRRRKVFVSAEVWFSFR